MGATDSSRGAYLSMATVTMTMTRAAGCDVAVTSSRRQNAIHFWQEQSPRRRFEKFARNPSIMGKRKLRSCGNCGGRHGPPTGKMCTRAEEAFVEKSEEMVAGDSGRAEAAAGAEALIDLSFQAAVSGWRVVVPRLPSDPRVHARVEEN